MLVYWLVSQQLEQTSSPDNNLEEKVFDHITIAGTKAYNMMSYLTLLTPVSFLTFYSTLPSLCFSLQWSDHRHSFRCAGWFDFLPGFVFSGCVVPPRSGYPPQESHEEVPGERRGESLWGQFNPMSCYKLPLLIVFVFTEKTAIWE